jgi:hypothetical protein
MIQVFGYGERNSTFNFLVFPFLYEIFFEILDMNFRLKFGNVVGLLNGFHVLMLHMHIVVLEVIHHMYLDQVHIKHR